MAYLSPIPRKRDGKGAGIARILALTGRVYLARKQRKAQEKAAAEKAAMETEALNYKRGREAAQDARAQQSLEIQQKNYERGVAKDEYQKERDAISDLYKQADLADKQGDNARADEYLRLAQQRESRMKAADARDAAKDAAGGGGAGTQSERDRKKWIDAFSGNYGNLPAGLDVRIKQRLEGLEAYDVPEALAKMFSGKEGEDVNDTFRHPIPNSVLASPDVQSAMWDYVARNRDMFGIKGNPEPEKKRWFQFWKKGGEAKEDPFAGYETEPTPTTGDGTYEDEIDALLGE